MFGGSGFFKSPSEVTNLILWVVVCHGPLGQTIVLHLQDLDLGWGQVPVPPAPLCSCQEVLDQSNLVLRLPEPRVDVGCHVVTRIPVIVGHSRDDGDGRGGGDNDSDDDGDPLGSGETTYAEQRTRAQSREMINVGMRSGCLIRAD